MDCNTIALNDRNEYTSSLPAWECGLKYNVFFKKQSTYLVTPCVGVWIEIKSYACSYVKIYVTPCVGVWLEIVLPCHS